MMKRNRRVTNRNGEIGETVTNKWMKNEKPERNNLIGRKSRLSDVFID